jgi:AraC-like DNA-binding protein
MEGGGAHFIDFTAYEIQPNSIHLVFPGQIHLLKRKGAKGLIVVCTREYMDSIKSVFYPALFQNNFTNPAILFPEGAFRTQIQTALSLKEELQQSAKLSAELTAAYMSILLTHCIRNFSPQHPVAMPRQNKDDMDLFIKFSALLEAQFIVRSNVASYATQLAMTPKALNGSIKKITGKTCIELINERVLTEAKRLLLYTDMNANEIAYALNFKDNSYFTRFFTKRQQQTPSAFRAYWEEKYHA